MYILLTSFVISLLGIIIMIAHKLAFTQEGKNMELEQPHPFVPDLQKIKYSLNKNTKKYGYLLLVFIIRLYVRFAKFFKQRYEEIKTKMKYIHNKHYGVGEGTKQEVSDFLKMMSDYKHKIRSIKHKIKEEEEIS